MGLESDLNAQQAGSTNGPDDTGEAAEEPAREQRRQDQRTWDFTGSSGKSAWLLPQVLCIVSARLSLRDVCGLLCVNTACNHVLTSHAPLWKKLELNDQARAGQRMLSALSLQRYKDLEEINLEFARDLEDVHVKEIRLQELEKLNLNACQKISDAAVEAVASANKKLKSFSIYWNLKVTDIGLKSLVTSCPNLKELNLSGCKTITDEGLDLIATHCPGILKLNLTRCLKLTDNGLMRLLESCVNIQELYLYAIPNFTDKAYKLISKCRDLRLLDVCGAQYLTDEGVAAIGECSKLVSLNLTWCVRVSSTGLGALARHFAPLELLSLHGLLGVTDEGLEKLSKSCSHSIHTLDVNGCIHIKRRSREHLLKLFPKLTTFVVHT